MSQNWEIKLRFEKALEKYAGNMEELEKINQIRNIVYTDSYAKGRFLISERFQIE